MQNFGKISINLKLGLKNDVSFEKTKMRKKKCSNKLDDAKLKTWEKHMLG